MIADARQFGEQHPQILCARRHLQVEQLLDRQHITMLHRQRRAIVEPVEIGQRLKIGLILDQFFGAAMEQPDMRVNALDDLAVEFEHEPQHAMRRRVLRAEVDRVIGDRRSEEHTSELQSLMRISYAVFCLTKKKKTKKKD